MGWRGRDAALGGHEVRSNATTMLLLSASTLAPAAVHAAPSCTWTYSIKRSDLRAEGYRSLAALFYDAEKRRVSVYEKVSKPDRHVCRCLEGQEECACCQVDRVKLCAEAREAFRTTQNRLIIDDCPLEAN
jgi:hypothetical protein